MSDDRTRPASPPPPSAGRPRRRGLVLAAACWLVACGVLPGSDADIEVVVERNGVLADGLPFRYQRLGEARLDELLQRERLAEHVDGETSEFARILLLKDWVAAQWPHSEPEPYPPWDAFVILDWIRAGRTGGFCAQYSQVFVQSLASLGLTGRYVEIGSRENPYAHYPVEVWSNEYDRWVLMDVDYNLHFERDGIPLNALDVHDALLQGEAPTLTPVLGQVRTGHPDPADWPLATAELYYYLRFHLKADHLTYFWEAPFDRLNDMVEWSDARAVPWHESPVSSEYPKERLTLKQTARREAPYPKLNQIHVETHVTAPATLELRLSHNVLDFAEYQVGRGRRVEDWRPHGSDALEWALASGENVIQIRGVNSRGIGGPPAVVRATYRPATAPAPSSG